MEHLKVLVVFPLGIEGNKCTPCTYANVEAAIKELKLRGPGYYDVIATVGGLYSVGQNISAARIMFNDIIDSDIGVRAEIPKFQICEEESRTTRENVSKLAIFLAHAENNGRKYDLNNFDLTIVSEKWHCKGIAYLVLRIMNKQCEIVESDFVITPRERFGRILRLWLYHRDPHGTGVLTLFVAWFRSLKAGATFSIPS